MRIYFLRHGIADWDDWDKPDAERPLNEKGKRQMRRVAAALVRRGLRPDAIRTSPLPRAQQTADLLAAALDMQASVEPALAPGFDATRLRALIAQCDGQDVVLVGHEPDLSGAVGVLTGGAVSMKKAGIACVRITDADAPAGELQWLLTPKMLA